MLNLNPAIPTNTQANYYPYAFANSVTSTTSSVVLVKTINSDGNVYSLGYGLAVDTSTFSPNYTAGNNVPLAISKDNGALLVAQGNLSPNADGVSCYGYDGSSVRSLVIISASLAKTPTSQVLLVQCIDQSGSILSSTLTASKDSVNAFAQAVDPSTFNPNYSVGSTASLVVDRATGGLLVSQGNLSPASDGIMTYGNDGYSYRALSVMPITSSKVSASSALIVQPIDLSGNIITSVNYIVSSSFTRPTNVLGYTGSYGLGKVVANSASNATSNVIINASRSPGGSGTIISAHLYDGTNAVSSGSYEAWIFRSNRTSENDTNSFTCSMTDLTNLIAVIPFQQSYVATSGSSGALAYIYQSPLSKPFACLPNTSSLYWNLICRNTYQPISGEQFILSLGIKPD